MIPHVKHLVKILNLEPDTEYNYRLIVEYEDKMYTFDINDFRTTPSDGSMNVIDK